MGLILSGVRSLLVYRNRRTYWGYYSAIFRILGEAPIACYENPYRSAATLSDSSKTSLRNREVGCCL